MYIGTRKINIISNHFYNIIFSFSFDRIVDVLFSVLTSSAIYHGFEAQSGYTKDYKYIAAASPQSIQHEGVRADWLPLNRDNLPE